MATEPTFDELWKEAVCDTVKAMSSAEFDELTRQRDAASRPAPRAEELPTSAPTADKIPKAPRAEDLPTAPPPLAPGATARDSIAAKREQARRMGRTAI